MVNNAEVKQDRMCKNIAKKEFIEMAICKLHSGTDDWVYNVLMKFYIL